MLRSPHRDIGALVAFWAACPLWAVAATLSVSNTSAVEALQTVEVAVSLAPAAGESVAAAQFEVGIPTALEFVDAVAGDAALDAGKDAAFTVVEEAMVRVIVIGFNQNSIGAGELARFTFRVRADAASGLAAVPLRNALLSSPVGTPIAVDTVDGTVLIDTGEEMALPVSNAASRAVLCMLLLALMPIVHRSGGVNVLAAQTPARRAGS